MLISTMTGSSKTKQNNAYYFLFVNRYYFSVYMIEYVNVTAILSKFFK